MQYINTYIHSLMIVERSCYEEALGFLFLRILLSFGSVFQFSHFKGAVFQFLCPVWFADFFQCSLWVSATIMAGFWIFLSIAYVLKL